jgi:CheY-like chemotaxis protein
MAAASQDPAVQPPVRPQHILILDDEPEVVATLADLLAIDGHFVDTATSGAMALEKLQTQTYGLILSDLRMPESNGPAFYQTLHRHHPALCQRLIFLTGDELSSETRAFLEHTAIPTLGKPLTLMELRSAVQQVLQSTG